LRSVSRSTDGLLDPRPMPGSPAWSGAMTVPDAFFTPVPYRGAFGNNLWIQGWTALDDAGYVSTAIEEDAFGTGGEVPARFALKQNYPNPFNPSTTISFTLDRAEQVRLAVFDVLGREVAVLARGMRPAGSYQVSFDASSFSSGVYVYQLRTEAGVFSRKMMLVK